MIRKEIMSIVLQSEGQTNEWNILHHIIQPHTGSLLVTRNFLSWDFTMTKFNNFIGWRVRRFKYNTVSEMMEMASVSEMLVHLNDLMGLSKPRRSYLTNVCYSHSTHNFWCNQYCSCHTNNSMIHTVSLHSVTSIQTQNLNTTHGSHIIEVCCHLVYNRDRIQIKLVIMMVLWHLIYCIKYSVVSSNS